MITAIVRGKALLVYSRRFGDPVPSAPEVSVFVQSASHLLPPEGRSIPPRDLAADDLRLGGYLPGFRPECVKADRIKKGETLRVYVTYELTYTRDYWGEHDIECSFPSSRILRRQQAKTPYMGRTTPHNH